MTLIRKLALALFLAFLSTSYSNSQTVDPVTGNLINTGTSATDTTSTWNNGVYVNQLCFYGGDPGNCGPNPSIRSGGVINYSYGTVDLNQIVNINKALSIGGSGVQLSGFNFGFMAKNGNGWDDGRQDYLGAYVKFYNSAGGLAANYDYTSQTNQRYNWSQFNFSETFASPVAASTYGNAQVGFVGRDNNFWAGNYGPEIYNVSFSLKYSVKPDPCINDPLSSPTCPGYALATVKNSILGSTVSNASATSFVPVINYTQPAPAVADATPGLAQTSPQQQAQQSPPPPPPQGPQPGQDPNQNPSVAQDGPAQPGPQPAGPAPTGPQPAGGPPPATQTASAPPPSAGPQSAGPQQGGSGPSKLAMSVVKSAQAKEQAIQQTAVQNAAKAFEGTVQSSQTASNAAVAMNQDMSASSATSAAQFSSQTTQASMQTAVQSTQSQSNTQQVAAVQSQRTSTVQSTQQTSSGTGLTVSGNPFAYNPLGSINTASMGPAPAAPSTYQPRLQERSTELDTPQLQVASVGGVGKAGNPLSDIMNQRIDLLQTNIEQRSDTVKKNVSPNELAGGVDVASMATIPRGYEAYSVVTLRDAAFYEPKEVYKNQKTVDNVRALRQMSSDSLHKQMVDSQYKEK